MKALFVTAAIIGLSLSACTKKSGQEHDGPRTRTQPLAAQESTAVATPTEVRTKTAAEEIAPSVDVTTVNALQAGLSRGTAQAVDANNQGTRDEFGVIPGAILLSGGTFESLELPEDRDTHLVFYCSSSACMAAPRAALRAREFGYNNVSILTAGIRGWVAAQEDVHSTD